MSEIAWLVSAIASGGYGLWTLAECLSIRFTQAALTPFAEVAKLWLAVILFPVFWVSFRKYNFLRKSRIHNCKPAIVYPHRDPILGTDWVAAIAKNLKAHTLINFWDNTFKAVGGTYWVQTVGTWAIMTNEPENIKTVLATKFEDWPLGGVRLQTALYALGPHAIFSVNGKAWQDQRAMIRPSFVRNQLADLDCTDRHVENFIARVPTDGRRFDLQQLFFEFTMDVSTDFMFGYSTDMLSNPTQASIDFSESFEYLLLGAATKSRLGWIGFLVPDSRYQSATKTCQGFIDKYVAEAIAEGKRKERPYVFLNEMLDSRVPLPHIRDQLLAMILGGKDTSASTMSSLFWVLARRPDVVANIKAELAELKGEKPTWEQLKTLKYLNNVMKEVLRLWSPVPTNLRIANKDTVLPKGGGPDGQSPMFVPKGSSIRWLLYNLHRRKDIYGEDADDFRPERWDNLRVGWGYVPFSGGPRICIGQQFAITQMLYLVARIFQTYDQIIPEDNRPVQLELSTTIKLVNGCWVSVR